MPFSGRMFKKVFPKRDKKSRDFVVVGSISDTKDHVPAGQNIIADGFNHAIRWFMPQPEPRIGDIINIVSFGIAVDSSNQTVIMACK